MAQPTEMDDKIMSKKANINKLVEEAKKFILETGYKGSSHCSAYEDPAIQAALKHYVAFHEKVKVAEFIEYGELGGDEKDADSILDSADLLLDIANSENILGQVVFKATNGKHYIVTTEAVIGEANPKYIKDVLQTKYIKEQV